MDARFISEQPFLTALESSKVVYSGFSAKSGERHKLPPSLAESTRVVET
jgi:hypothetical protein